MNHATIRIDRPALTEFLRPTDQNEKHRYGIGDIVMLLSPKGDRIVVTVVDTLWNHQGRRPCPWGYKVENCQGQCFTIDLWHVYGSAE